MPEEVGGGPSPAKSHSGINASNNGGRDAMCIPVKTQGSHQAVFCFVSGQDFVASAEGVAAEPRFDDLRLIANDLRAIDVQSIDADANLAVAASRIGAMRTDSSNHVAFLVRPQDMLDLQKAVAPCFQAMPFDSQLVLTMSDAL
jgi:hypothetical protein